MYTFIKIKKNTSMLIQMHLITLFRVMKPHQRCLQAKVKYRNEPKSEDLSRSLEIIAIWTFDTEFPTIFNKSIIMHIYYFEVCS